MSAEDHIDGGATTPAKEPKKRVREPRQNIMRCICEHLGIKGPGSSLPPCKMLEELKQSSPLYGCRVSLPKADEKPVGGLSRRSRWLRHLGLREKDLDGIHPRRQVLCWTHFEERAWKAPEQGKRRDIRRTYERTEQTDKSDRMLVPDPHNQNVMIPVALVVPDVPVSRLVSPREVSSAPRSKKTSSASRRYAASLPDMKQFAPTHEIALEYLLELETKATSNEVAQNEVAQEKADEPNKDKLVTPLTDQKDLRALAAELEAHRKAVERKRGAKWKFIQKLSGAQPALNRMLINTRPDYTKNPLVAKLEREVAATALAADENLCKKIERQLGVSDNKERNRDVETADFPNIKEELRSPRLLENLSLEAAAYAKKMDHALTVRPEDLGREW